MDVTAASVGVGVFDGSRLRLYSATECFHSLSHAVARAHAAKVPGISSSSGASKGSGSKRTLSRFAATSSARWRSRWRRLPPVGLAARFGGATAPVLISCASCSARFFASSLASCAARAFLNSNVKSPTWSHSSSFVGCRCCCSSARRAFKMRTRRPRHCSASVSADATESAMFCFTASTLAKPELVASVPFFHLVSSSSWCFARAAHSVSPDTGSPTGGVSSDRSSSSSSWHATTPSARYARNRQMSFELTKPWSSSSSISSSQRRSLAL
mmetsp:Transcript_6347/g.21734  ORF Transcript_6347/g.21734 Transcript_6347/m.21734 type:complete len:271 (+) Transcript_6347:685-1497(+)